MIRLGVLGAGGFVGSRIVEAFHLRGRCCVVPIVRRPASLANVARFDLGWRIADAMDEAALRSAFDGCEAVVHTVMGHPSQIPHDVAPVYRAAEAAGVRRIIYMSSAAVHGQNPPPGTSEASPFIRRRSLYYNNAKMRAERRLLRMRRFGAVQVVVLRPSIVFGPRDVWISAMVQALRRGAPYLVDGGEGICNTTYIDNLVHAVDLALDAQADGEAFIIVDAETVTWRCLYETVAQQLFGRGPDPAIADPILVDPGPTLVDRLRRSPAWHAIKPYFPHPVSSLMRRGSRALLAAAEAARAAWDDERAPSAGRTRISVPRDLALLHACGYKLPYSKARDVLDYEPVVTVEEGLRRTIEWHRIVDPTLSGLSSSALDEHTAGVSSRYGDLASAAASRSAI